MVSRLDSICPMTDIAGRAQSQANIEVDIFLRVTNYEETLRQLDMYYGIIKRKILAYQSITLGIFPSFSEETDIGDVRTSINCAKAIWSLFQAYRRIDDDRGRSYELSQSAIKCMRGILQCWLRQASRIEKFKELQCHQNALHIKFHLETGEEVISEQNYGHLQASCSNIDVISLYLITLTQMINSGLQIIYTMDEVNFIQNLVYYVERAYRTPDFGMWERGSKYNNGTPEMHASSIGMAKSALEAINGLNLFGERGASWSVIYVDIDAHNRNRSIFEALLPRESSSKNTDASLLTTISYPAFATHDDAIYVQTKGKVIAKLKGEYGFKRFLRDGYGTVVEDPCRRFYYKGETKEFENIESEWPLFFAYLVIDGIFKGDQEQVKDYQKLLKKRVRRDKYGDPLIPQYYFVPVDSVSYEKQDPGSQPRVASKKGSSSSNVFLWGTSVYIISQLLVEGLLHVNEIDPIRRYLPSYTRPRRTGRYSAFQGTASDLVVQVVLIAESMRLQAMMATYGIQTQTPHEVEPVQIWPPSELIKIYKYLGISKKLGLDGRPARPIGALGTSKIYRICGQTVLCYPLIFEVSDFYLSHDMALLIDDIRTELQFVGRHWRLTGRPTICLLIREEHMRDPKFREMLDLLAQLKSGYCDGLKVRMGRLQNLMASSCIEHLDFLNLVDVNLLEVSPFQQLQHASIGYQSLTDIPKAIAYSEPRVNFEEFELKSTSEIMEALKMSDTMWAQSHLLCILLRREGFDYMIEGVSVRERLVLIERQAGMLKHWSVVRFCSSLLQKLVHSVSPCITSILVTGKQLTIGVVPKQEVVLDKPMAPSDIRSLIYSSITPDTHDIFQAVLQQEIILYAGKLISTHPDIFSGILKFRVGWVLRAMETYQKAFVGEEAEPLECCSPSEIRRLLFKVLTIEEWAEPESLIPYIRRQLEGCLGRVPPDFYQRVWQILSKASKGLIIGKNLLPQQPTLSEMTMSEHGFAIRIEEMLNSISCPEYRQVLVELVLVISTILTRNPELYFPEPVDLDDLLSKAFMLTEEGKVRGDMKPFFSASYAKVTGYLARAVVNHILSDDISSFNLDDQCCKVS